MVKVGSTVTVSHWHPRGDRLASCGRWLPPMESSDDLSFDRMEKQSKQTKAEREQVEGDDAMLIERR